MDLNDRLNFLRYLARRLALGPSEIEICHRPGRPTTIDGRVPRAKEGAIREFFERDLTPTGVIRVWGNFGPGRAPRLSFCGPLTARQRQRARNFLTELLR